MKNISIKGFGLIEIILVIGVGMAVFLGVLQYLNSSLKLTMQDSHQTEALYWAKANLEQARAVRDEAVRSDNWALLYDLSVDPVQYQFIVDDTTTPDSWDVQPGARTEGRYAVWFTTSQVSRDTTAGSTKDDIVAAGGAIDPNTLKINSNVSWLENGATKQIIISEYLVNF